MSKVMHDLEREERLKAEAEFQNQRTVESAQHGGEARDRFYYLLEGAFARFANSLKDVDGRLALVVGCAEGGVTPLTRRGCRVVGVDIAEIPIQQQRDAIAREGFGDMAELLVMNAEEPDFPPNHFDLIACRGVLHHLDIPLSIPNWARVLKPGGSVKMVEPMAWNPLIALYRALTPSMRTPDEHPLVPKDIRLLKEHFRHVEVHAYAMFTLLSLPFAYIPGAGPLKTGVRKLLEPLDRLIFTLLPITKYFAWAAYIEARDPIEKSG